MTDQLQGDVLEWTQYGDSGWGYGSVRAAQDNIRVPIVGTILGLRPGDSLSADGMWIVHAKHGRQFQVTSARVSSAATVEGAVLWISATLPHLGPERARQMVMDFGGPDETFHAIEHDTDRLLLIDGITPQRAALIKAAYLDARADRDHQVALRGWGLTDNQVSKCLETWGSAEAAVKAIRDNPYDLFRKVPGFGWMRADTVALRTGLPVDSPMRIATGIEHTLSQYSGDGHVWMAVRLFQNLCEDNLRLPREIVVKGIQRAVREGAIYKRSGRVYLGATDRKEDALRTAIKARVAG